MYIGIMSGTSLDGVDAGLFSFEDATCTTHATYSKPFDSHISETLRDFARGSAFPASAIGELDALLAKAYADAASALIEQASAPILAIGCHGQTVWHQPDGPHGFTWQLGNPHQIVESTGITTVADFRRADVAAGGQGAPLAPLFHRWLWQQLDATIVNIGGIANITPSRQSTGFDCGPGNTLMDAWTQIHQSKSFDDEGQWALSGTVMPELLSRLQSDPYFQANSPKSTGPEYFSIDWLKAAIGDLNGSEADVQATLLELTAWCIANAANQTSAKQTIVCGGGSYNLALMRRLEELCEATVECSESHGLGPQWVESACFAWLAKQAIEGVSVDTRQLTGAKHPIQLGVIYPA